MVNGLFPPAQVRLAVREGTRALLGSASQWLEVPDAQARPLTLSSVFLLADSLPESGDVTDVQVDKVLHPGQGLHYAVHVYGGGAGAALQGAVLQAQIWQGGRVVGVTPKHELTAGGAPDAAPQPSVEAASVPAAKWSERIALQGFAPGVYELRVIVSDREGKPAAQRRVAFRVE
jgi:hypothetical protein